MRFGTYLFLQAPPAIAHADARSSKFLSRWGVSRHVYMAPTDAETLAEAKEAEP
jgi:hypothetical protein